MIERPLPRWREELKFWVNQDQKRQILRASAPFVVPDPHARFDEPGVYTVRSIYYDSPRLDFYYHTLDGIRTRKKLRVRLYAGDGSVPSLFFEIKHKRGRRVLKERAGVAPALGVDAMVTQTVPPHRDLPDGEARAVYRFMMFVRQLALAPIVLVCYERLAYVDRANPLVRLTIDQEVRSLLKPMPHHLFEDVDLRPCTNGRAILELKFADLMPRWMRALISEQGLKACSISKYCMSLESWLRRQATAAVRPPG